MRVSPTGEQLAYLTSIGVAEDTLSQAGRGPAASEKGDHAQHDDAVTRGPCWAWFALIAVLLVLVACDMALGAENPQLSYLMRQPEIKPAAQRMRDFEARLRDVNASLFSLNERVDQTAASLRAQREAEEFEAPALLREELQIQADQTDRLVVLLMIMLGLLTVFVVRERVLMGNRIKQLEMGFLAGTAVGPGVGAGAANGNGDNRTPTKSPIPPRDIGFKPARPAREKVPGMREQLDVMIKAAAKMKRFRVRLRHPEGAWTMGLATTKGNVRTENQDFGLCFQINDDYDVLIVADGCGGVPHGQRAAYLASASAAASVVQTYGTTPLLFAPHIEEAAAQAIKDAAHRLAAEGDKLNVTESRDGLRTTLIVLVGNRREIAFAYIGDGGGCVLRASGAVESFLTPQKASALAMNVLAASLGPTIEGEFVVGTIKRMPGDLVLVGSDGIFDRVGSGFPKDVLRGCIQFNGDLQATADRIVEELAAFKDDAGFVCDDNATLGLMGDGTAPRLSQGFWFTAPSQDAPAEAVARAVEAKEEAAV
jgi:serine/threonine protein phosphatase PrpC